MTRIAVSVAVAAVVVAFITAAYALTLTNRLDGAERSAAMVTDLSNRLDDAAQAASARASDLEAQVTDFENRLGQVEAQLDKVRDCIPDLQLEVELLDVRSSGGTFMPFETVATHVKRSCRAILHVLFIGAD